jgi:hypothetical protein
MEIYNHIPREELEIVIVRYNEDIALFSPFNNNLVIYNKGDDDINSLINQNNIIKCDNIGREGGTYLKYIIDNYYDLPNYIIFTQANISEYIYPDNILLSFKEIYDVVNEFKNYKFKYISKNMITLYQNQLYDYTTGIPSLQIELGESLSIEKLLNVIDEWCEDNYITNIHIDKLKQKLEIMLSTNKKTIHLYEYTQLYEKEDWFMTNKEGFAFRKDTSYIFDFSKIMPLINNNYTFGYGSIFIVNKNQILKYPKSFWEKMYLSFLEKTPSASWGLEKLWPFILEY